MQAVPEQRANERKLPSVSSCTEREIALDTKAGAVRVRCGEVW